MNVLNPHVVACATVAMLLGSVSSLMALEPQTSTRVSSVTVSDVYGKIDVDSTSTLLVGIDGCERAMSTTDGGTITTTFVTQSFDPTTAMVTGVAYYEGSYYFDLPRSSGSSPGCTLAACNDVDEGDVTLSSTQAAVDVTFKQLTGLLSAQDCSTSTLERDYFVRFQITDGTTPDEADGKISVDLVRPEPPASFSAVITEKAIKLTWEDGTSGDVESYRIFYRATQFEGGVFSDELTGASSTSVSNTTTNINTATIPALTPGVTMWLAVASVDTMGNESALTPAQPFVVIDTVDFWDVYKGSGGSEEGGYCSSAPHSSRAGGHPGLLLLCGLFIGLGAMRRSRQHGARS